LPALARRSIGSNIGPMLLLHMCFKDVANS